MDLPKFPEDLSTAAIETIDLAKLVAGDEEQCNALFQAAQGYGFFYLRNHGVDDQIMFNLANDIFALPLEEKMRFDMGTTGNYFGYKSAGSQFIDAKGTRDASEFYNISKDSILRSPAQDALAHPALVQERRGELSTFMRACHHIVLVILSVLGRKLGLEEGTLPDLHDIDGSSGDQVRLTQATAIDNGRIAVGEHTDFGSVTVLFNRLGGLQVLSPTSAEFQYVRPMPGMAIINLGDAMVKLVGGRLRSGLHRVVGPPGEQAHCKRHSVVYFARPNGSVLLRSLFSGDTEGDEPMTADAWIANRVKSKLAINYHGEQSFHASRGTEHNKDAFMVHSGDQRKAIGSM